MKFVPAARGSFPLQTVVNRLEQLHEHSDPIGIFNEGGGAEIVERLNISPGCGRIKHDNGTGWQIGHAGGPYGEVRRILDITAARWCIGLSDAVPAKDTRTFWGAVGGLAKC